MMGRQDLLGACFAVALWGAGAANAQELHDKPILWIELGQHTNKISGIDVDAEERFVVSGSHDKTIRVWSAVTGELNRVIHIPSGFGKTGRVYTVAISPDGNTIAAAGGRDLPAKNRSTFLIGLPAF